MKDFGLTARKADGSRADHRRSRARSALGCRRSSAEHSRLDAHGAIHRTFWDPIDYSNERWLELALFPDRRCPPDPASHASKRSSPSATGLFKKHPENQVRRGALSGGRPTTLRAWPVCSTRCRTCTWKPGPSCTTLAGSRDSAHAFLVKYQDRRYVRQGQLPARRVPVLLADPLKRATSTSITTAITTLSGSCTELRCQTTFSRSYIFENALKIIPGLSRAGFPRVASTVAHYLVTGGAGFIGSHLCEELVRRGERVRVVDSLITGKRENLAHLPEVEFLQGDLADIGRRRRAVQGMDYVLHQAAIPSVPRSVEDPVTSNRANIDASLNLLVAARDAGVRRVVYAGSSSAYGNSPTLPKVETMPTGAAVAVCAAEARGGTVPARCSRGSTGSRR